MLILLCLYQFAFWENSSLAVTKKWFPVKTAFIHLLFVMRYNMFLHFESVHESTYSFVLLLSSKTNLYLLREHLILLSAVLCSCPFNMSYTSTSNCVSSNLVDVSNLSLLQVIMHKSSLYILPRLVCELPNNSLVMCIRKVLSINWYSLAKMCIISFPWDTTVFWTLQPCLDQDGAPAYLDLWDRGVLHLFLLMASRIGMGLKPIMWRLTGDPFLWWTLFFKIDLIF